uniref:Zinc finger CCHC domain-containing protein 7 n=1 Tax=Trichuris muris TaxID=70415 RepID=A0A5S6QV67_TRIMR
MSEVQYPLEAPLDSAPAGPVQPNDVAEGDEVNREYPGNQFVKLSSGTDIDVEKVNHYDQFSTTAALNLQEPLHSARSDDKAYPVSAEQGNRIVTSAVNSSSEAEGKEEYVENPKLQEDCIDARMSGTKVCAKIGLNFDQRPAKDVCQFCNGIGHNHRSCQQLRLKCYICGTWGHPGYLCAMRACLICFTFGHFTSKCPVSRSSIYKRICNRCHCRGHLEKDCPDLWRQFHSSTGSHCTLGQNWEKKNQTCLYCFNCGSEGHLGYQCNRAGLYNNRIFHFKPYVTVYSTLEELRITKTSQALEIYEQLHKRRGSSHDKESPVFGEKDVKTLKSIGDRKRTKRTICISRRKRLLLQEQPSLQKAKSGVKSSQTEIGKD